MAREVRLPQLGETMGEGTVVNWLVKPGSEVKKGEVIFEVETDKATLEVESPADGVVKHILVQAGQTVPVNTPVMVLGGPDEQVPESFIESLTTTPPVQSFLRSPTKDESPDVGRILASPRAKKFAAELGVDLSSVTGTGPEGRIVEADVRRAKTQATQAAGNRPGRRVALSRKQQILGRKMSQSKREIPCFYLTISADVTELVGLRRRMNESADVNLAYTDFIIKAVGLALQKYPLLSGQLAGDYIMLADSINIALAVTVGDELVAPVVKDVRNKDIRQIARETQVLIAKARDNKLSLTELEGGCITISNIGSLGVNMFIPIVTPGQCSVIGVGQIADVCVPAGGEIMVRKKVNLTLSVDHRVVNGAYAAQFLDFLCKLLEDGSTFAL
jgi:pyruvate dehydrogenase E2 component (dihydrolipoamide acetyltransferase)